MLLLHHLVLRFSSERSLSLQHLLHHQQSPRRLSCWKTWVCGRSGQVVPGQLLRLLAGHRAATVGERAQPKSHCLKVEPGPGSQHPEFKATIWIPIPCLW